MIICCGSNREKVDAAIAQILLLYVHVWIVTEIEGGWIFRICLIIIEVMVVRRRSKFLLDMQFARRRNENCIEIILLALGIRGGDS